MRAEHWLYTVPLRLRSLFHRNEVERELEEELQFHLDQQIRQHVADGMSAAEARTAALRALGGYERRKEQCRDARRVNVVEHMLRDVRHAFRTLIRNPGFALAAVLTLALGIGASTAMFSVVNGVLVRQLPYAAPAGLVRIWEVSPRADDHNAVSSGNYVDWRARSRSFAEIGAHRWPYSVALTGEGEPIQVMRADVTPSVMRVLGVTPMLGRALAPEDARQGGNAALLSYGFWRSRYGRDRSVIGRGVTLNDTRYTIVGVMPRSFDFPSPTVQLYRAIPDEEIEPEERRSHNFGVIARLAPGATVESAKAELSGIAAALTSEYPQFMTGYGVNVVGMHEDIVQPVRPLLLVLFAGVVVVLLIACANVSNLLLAKAVARESEMAIRGSLGASRARLIAQTLSESFVLALISATIGIAIAAGLLRLLLALAPADIPLLDRVQLDAHAFAYALGVSMVSAILFGLVPALRLSRVNLQASMRAGQRGSTAPHMSVRNALFAAEVALSLVLLTGAGLVVRSFQRAQGSDLGLDGNNVLAASIDLPRARYENSTMQRAAYDAMLEQVRRIPGVALAGVTSDAPAAGPGATFSFTIEGRPSVAPSGRYDPHLMYVVTPEYFSALRIPLLRGRVFAPEDHAGAPPVALVSESLAKLYWNGDVVGKRIRFGGDDPWLEIVGVVGDTRTAGADQPPPPMLYTSLAQKTRDWLSWGTLIVRPAPGVDARTLAPLVRSAIWRVDSQLPIHRLSTLEELFGESIARRKFAATLLVIFAGAALLLGTIGIYGVLSYSVLHRRKEIGIRMALGARADQVVMGVVRDAWRVTCAGIAIGLAGTLAGTQLLRSLLYEVSPTDTPTLIAVSALLLAVATAAAWVPARRAARTAPLLVIRDG